MLLTLDDAHWADPASLRYLSFLGRRLERVPTLVAATTRLAESSGEDKVLTRMAQDPLTELVDLEPLSLNAVSLFMRSQLGGDALTGWRLSATTRLAETRFSSRRFWLR